MKGLREVEAFWEKVCFDPNYQPEGRFRTYRDLVFEGMLEVVQNICPVICSILSEADIKNLFWDFLRSAPPRSPVLRELPWEVSQFLRNGGHPLLEKYPWLGELMEYEYLEIQVRFKEESEEKSPPGKVLLTPAHALGEYTWPVHFISRDHHDPHSLPRGKYYLLLWRDPVGLGVKFMEVNLPVAAMVKKLRERAQAPLDLLEATAKEAGLPFSDEYRLEGEKMIGDFISQGILRTSSFR